MKKLLSVLILWLFLGSCSFGWFNLDIDIDEEDDVLVPEQNEEPEEISSELTPEEIELIEELLQGLE